MKHYKGFNLVEQHGCIVVTAPPELGNMSFIYQKPNKPNKYLEGEQTIDRLLEQDTLGSIMFDIDFRQKLQADAAEDNSIS